MKLLFDQNLSPRLVDLLVDVFPESSHVLSVNLDRASDEGVWSFAREQGFVIVTKDSDFQERSQIARSAPCVVWIRRGNSSTAYIESMLATRSALRQPVVGPIVPRYINDPEKKAAYAKKLKGKGNVYHAAISEFMKSRK